MTSPSFRELGLTAPVLEALEAAEFAHATPVQATAIPVLMRGDDVIIQAQTGTGKTVAFAVPIVERVEPVPGRIQALVLAPTRELAAQVAREVDRVGARRNITACPIYGGAGFEPQIEGLRTAQVVVATPGRLLDHLRRRNLSLNDLKMFGLDEADEMLSMGFEKDVFDVVSFLPAEKQCFVCSATINDPILRLANAFLRNPVTIDLSSDSIGARSVDHRYFAVNEAAKLEALRRVLPTWAQDGAIIFANTKVATFRIHEALSADGLPVGVINGDLPQSERERALARMRDDRISYLVATDVAARGIDISGLPAVVNYDMPDSPDNYVHRTGRTGRAGQFGIALSLVTPADISVFHHLEKFYRIVQKPADLPRVEDVRRVRADRFLSEALQGLDADGSLPYADFLAAAARLGETADGARSIAKLIAFFQAHRDAAATPPAADTMAALDADTEPDTPPSPSAPETPAETPAPADADTPAEPATASSDTPPAEMVGERPPTAPSAAKPAKAPSPDDDAAVMAAGEEMPDAPSAPPSDDAQAADDDTLSERLYAWLDENSGADGRERMRSIRAIASGVGIPMRKVREVAEAHPQLELGGHRRSMVRILEGEPSTSQRPAPPAPAREAASPPPRPAPSSKPRGSSARPAPERAAARPARKPSERTETVFDRRAGHKALKLNIPEAQVSDPETLAEDLALLAGLEREDLGRIDCRGDHCVVEISDIYWKEFHDALQGAPWNQIILKVGKL